MEKEKIGRYIGRPLAILGLVAAPFLGVGASPVSAQGVIRISGECGMLDGNGNAVSTQGEVTVVPSGNRIEVCKAQVTPSSEGGAKIYNYENTGYLCGLGGVELTRKWRLAVAASGEATLICLANPSSE